MKALKAIALAALIGANLWSPQALAQAAEPSKEARPDRPTAADMTDGEIRKIDKDHKKLTIKHGEIRNLDMPGMTMVFQVKDPAMVDKIKVGDKVRFSVEKSATGFVVTDMEAAHK